MINTIFTYSRCEQEEIYSPEANKAIEFAKSDEYLNFMGHGKLDVFTNDDDWRTALLYACGALRDTVNLYAVFDNISEESNTCNQLYTPEVYLLAGFDTYKTKKYREIYGFIEEKADYFSSKLAEHSIRCQNDVLSLLQILVDNNRTDLLAEVFHEHIELEQLGNWLNAVMKDRLKLELMERLFINGAIVFNVSLDESMDIVMETIIKNVVKSI